MAISFDRRIQILRATSEHDGLQNTETFSPYGSPKWASRKDISDSEKQTAGWLEATLASRFTVQSSSFTRGITAKDRIDHDGKVFDIKGVKELGYMALLEITAIARVDT